MKTARIPAPGLVLGQYPQRRAPDPAWPLLRRFAALLGRGADARRALRLDRVAAVRSLQPAVAGEPDALRRERVARLRVQLARDGFNDTARVEALALISVICREVLGVAPYDAQLFAAQVLLDGQLAEMATGEGKTLAAALAAATAAWAGIPVHVLTANDYLVARDAATLRPLYQALGLTVGAVTQPLPAAARRDAYACDITYCTAKELVFDYLRDGITAPRLSALEQRAAGLSGAAASPRLLRGLCMAIIDEADSLLIDEARVPLVLSRAVAKPHEAALTRAWVLSASLAAGRDFALDRAARCAQLSAAGRERLGALAVTDGAVWLNRRHRDDMLALALTARHLLQRGRDYVVENGHVHLVDETTGRKAAGRAWSQGLQQLVDIKEGCTPSAQLVTLAQMTYQRFFPRYLRLCGMSGTLTESRRELRHIYDLQVARVPLRKASRRELLPPRVYADAASLWPAVVARVREMQALGRPVLVGTDSVIDSESLSRHLRAAAIAHAVLNATQDQHEARIVAAAGAAGVITVATNMAGRGTDIVLSAKARAAGGLHIICCQQNASRRIDRQLLGRCARQGDPGSVEVFIALDGALLAHHRAIWIYKILFKNKYLRYIRWGSLLLRGAQRDAERCGRREREVLMRRDRQVDDWFAFSGNEQ
jgi:preprotein translocase subunit SecA